MGHAVAEQEYLTASEAGQRIGLTAFQVTRTYEDLPALKEAAKHAGYLAG